MSEIIITEVRNARYITPRGDIDMEINHPTYGWIPYCLSYDDTDMTIDNEKLKVLAEQVGVAPLDPAEWEERLAAFARMEREARLKIEVDPLVTNPLRWGALDESTQQAWADYRQALLDVPQQESFPYEIEWPEAP